MAATLLASGCGGDRPSWQSDPDAEPAEQQAQPAAYQALAQLDGAPDADPYARALLGLSRLCNEGGNDLADIAVVTRDVLAREGVEVTLLGVLRGIGASVPEDAAPTDCDEVAAAWATLRMSG